MKKLFTALLLLASAAFFAQTAPVIEGTYYPVRNTSIKQVWDTTNGSIAVPAIGINQVWDYRFSNGQFSHVVDTFRFQMLDPLTSPHSQYFPNATHAGFIRTPFNNISDSLYEFYKLDYTGMHNLGGFNTKYTYDSTFIMTQSEFVAPPSLPYLYTKTDTSKYIAYAKHYAGYKGKIRGRRIKTFKYVGYGTLRLPNFDYNNVALVKEDYSTLDSVFVDLLNNNNYTFLTISTASGHIYEFFRNNTFGSAYLAYMAANPANNMVDYGWYTLPVDFGSISGTVFTNTLETTHVTSGEAYLYRENSNFTKHDILAKSFLDANGNYKFDSIPYGEYRIAIRPDTIAYPNSMITYFGDTTNWMDATPIITTTTTSTGHKIHIRHSAVPVGLNNISGQLNLNLSIMRSMSPLSNPIPGVGIVVKKNPGSNAERTMVTDGSGNFNLGNLDDGNYTLFVDIPGLHMSGTYSFTSVGNNVINGLDFIIGTDSIHPVNASAVGIKENKKTSASLLNAYPNPYSSVATIVLNVPAAGNVLLEVYDILGKKVQTLDNSEKQQGNYKYTFSARSMGYGAGMYFIKLKTGNTNNVLKIVEQ